MRKPNNLRDNIHEVIFEADTPWGKAFDVVLLILILASVLTVMLESIESWGSAYGKWFLYLEWGFTIVFTIEYFLRLYSVRRPLHYAGSTWGIIDLMAILPTYLSLIFVDSHYLLIIRGLRLLRVFRIFKLVKFLQESNMIIQALRASRLKITVFLIFVLLCVTIIGSVLYLVEGGVNDGFSSIPKGIYWAIVTLTTVGYGDIHPITNLGQFLAAFVMILGYAVLAVPTGIVSAEMVNQQRTQSNSQVCRYCVRGGHADDAVFCKYCGEKLNEDGINGKA